MTKRLRSIYHGYVQIAEIDATDETAPYVAKTYRWDPSEPVATRPLALTLWTREGTERETLYYAHDLRKNVVSLFDGKGMRRASYQYDPYGNITSMEGDMARENPYRYSSEHHDEDLGLVYYNYRHYNPTDGRWTSRDPIAEKGGWNLYAFVGNNALNFFDWLGLYDREYIGSKTISTSSSLSSDEKRTACQSIGMVPDRPPVKGLQSPPFSVTAIPSIMRELNWNTSATCMERWFDGDGSPSTDLITWSWLLKFTEVQVAMVQFTREWRELAMSGHNDFIDRSMQQLFKNIRQKTFKPFSDIGNDVGKWRDQQVTYVPVKWYKKSGQMKFHDLGGSLGDFHIYVMYDGVPVEYCGKQCFIFTQIGFYARDEYSFNDKTLKIECQSLGFWDRNPAYAGMDMTKGYYVSNRSFKSYQRASGYQKGRDYDIYSDLLILPLKKPILICEK